MKTIKYTNRNNKIIINCSKKYDLHQTTIRTLFMDYFLPAWVRSGKRDKSARSSRVMVTSCTPRLDD